MHYITGGLCGPAVGLCVFRPRYQTGKKPFRPHRTAVSRKEVATMSTPHKT